MTRTNVDILNDPAFCAFTAKALQIGIKVRGTS